MQRGAAFTRGVVLAAIAAVAFGLTTPVVAWAGRGLGPFATAALLYAGAAVASGVLLAVSRQRGPALRRTDAPRIAAIAIAGGALGPTLLAWGLQRSGATVGALLLNL
ncbi:MAG TPA: EamA family transporter, partial [Kofleriaceae bacterium]|nr:EamA family transporter [Kofleriaceae bacterium]